MRTATLTLNTPVFTAPHAGWLAAARGVRNVLLFAAAPFIGLAYAMALPFVGVAMLVWVAARKEPAAR